MSPVLQTLVLVGTVVVADYLLLGGPNAEFPAMWRRRTAFIIEAATLAVAYFSMTTTLFFMVLDGDVLAGTIANVVVIVAVVVWDHIVDVLRSRVYTRLSDAGFRRRWHHAAWWLTGASWKSSLYIFYIALLIAQAFVAANPDIQITAEVSGYLSSVRYGLLILVASDKFADQMVKELGREEQLRRRARQAPAE